MLGFRNEAAAAVGNGCRFRCPCSRPPRRRRQRLNSTKSGSQPVRKQLHCSHTHTTYIYICECVCVFMGVYIHTNMVQCPAP